MDQGTTRRVSEEAGGTMQAPGALERVLEFAPTAYFRWLLVESYPIVSAGGNLDQLGYTAEDFTSGRVPWIGITHPDDVPRLEAEIAKCFAMGIDSFSNRYRLRTAAGDYVWIQDWNHMTRHADGTPHFLDGIVVRVSDILAADEVSQITHESPLYGMCILQDGKVAYANEALCRLSGLAASDAVGAPLARLLGNADPSDRERVVSYYADRVEGKPAPQRYEIRTVVGGETRWLGVSARRAVYRGRAAVHEVYSDVTSRKQAEKALERMRDDLELMVRERTSELEEANKQLRYEAELRKEAEAELAQHQEHLEALVSERTAELLEANAELVAALHARDMAQRDLRESERNFRAIAENAQEAIIICDKQESVLYANSFACEMTGYSESELLNINGLSILVPEDTGRVWRFSRDRLAGVPVPHPYEATLVAKAGRLITVEVTGAATEWRGRPATIGMLRDVTDRKHVDRELEFSRMMLERAQEVANTGSWTLDLSSNKVTWSRELYRIAGVDPETYQPAHEERPRLIHPQDLDLVNSEMARVVRERSSSRMESRLIRPDGEVRDILSQLEYVDGAGRAPDLVVGTATDITEKRRLEKDLLDAAQQEQQRVGRDLHDTLGQELAGIAFLAKALQRQVADLAPSAADAASRLAELARLSVEQCRRIAHGLAPLTIEAERLGQELEKLCAGAAELHDTPCDCSVTFDGEINDSRIASHVYQIAREAVMNAMRHAGASRVILQLDVADRFGELVVSDDGSWGDVGGSPRGIGLRVMRHRSELIGGVFDIQHADGCPTTVTCRFPCRPSV